MSKMSDNFYKIKKKHLIWAIVKSAICGISFGLFVTGILLLAFKLNAITFAVGYYVLIGIGVALLGGGASFLFLFKPTDKKVARLTDEDFSLNERVQTALAYSDKEGTVVQLQREDAEEKIKSLPRRRFSFARIWQFCLIAVVALAIGAAGIFVPAKEAEGGVFVDPDSTPREVSDDERLGVRELIKDINDSELAADLKSGVVSVLEQLLVDFNNCHTAGTIKHAVTTAIDDADFILSSTLSYVDIGAALTKAEQVYLGNAVTKGGVVYQYYSLTTYDETRVFYLASYNASNAKVGAGITSLRNDLVLNISDGLPQLLGDTSSAVKSALTTSGISENNGLYMLLESFAESLLTIRADADRGATDIQVQNSINDLITKVTVNLTSELSTQAYNGAMSIFISNRLKTIFGYRPLILPLVDPDNQDTVTPENPETPDDPPGEGPSDGPGGSIGDGDLQYGSDDEVWVPGRGYVKYGELMDEYYTLINQYLHSGQLTEEQKNMIEAYYDILWGSNKNK